MSWLANFWTFFFRQPQSRAELQIPAPSSQVRGQTKARAKIFVFTLRVCISCVLTPLAPLPPLGHKLNAVQIIYLIFFYSLTGNPPLLHLFLCNNVTTPQLASRMWAVFTFTFLSYSYTLDKQAYYMFFSHSHSAFHIFTSHFRSVPNPDSEGPINVDFPHK